VHRQVREPLLELRASLVRQLPQVAEPARASSCGKQWQSCGLARCAVQQEELPEAQRAARGAAGTVPEQRAQGALRPARAQRADSRGDATETNKKANAARHDETHQTGGHSKQQGR